MDLLIARAKSSLTNDIVFIEEVESYLLNHDGPMSLSAQMHIPGVEPSEEYGVTDEYKYTKKLSTTFFKYAEKVEEQHQMYFYYYKYIKKEGSLVGEYAIFVCRQESIICSTIYEENLKDKRITTKLTKLDNHWEMVAYFYDVY
jgi:hypothetical protein